MQGELPSQRITEGVIWKQLLFFFFPILLGSFFQQMYNTVDTIIVGRFVGTRALAAVGSTSALLNLMNGFFIGLSTGATVLLSQFYGAKSKQGVQDTLHTGVALSLVLEQRQLVVKRNYLIGRNLQQLQMLNLYDHQHQFRLLTRQKLLCLMFQRSHRLMLQLHRQTKHGPFLY